MALSIFLEGLIWSNEPMSYTLWIPVSATEITLLTINTVETNTWKKVFPSQNVPYIEAPAPRSGAHSLSFENSVFFFGGYTRKGGTYFNDLTEFKTI